MICIWWRGWLPLACGRYSCSPYLTTRPSPFHVRGMRPSISWTNPSYMSRAGTPSELVHLHHRAIHLLSVPPTEGPARTQYPSLATSGHFIKRSLCTSVSPPPRAHTRSASKHSRRPYCTSTTAPTADSIASHPIVSHRTLLSQPTHMGSRLWTNFPPSPVNRSTVRVRPEPSLSIIISQIGFEGALRSQAASGVYVLSYLPLWRSFCGAGESGLLI